MARRFAFSLAVALTAAQQEHARCAAGVAGWCAAQERARAWTTEARAVAAACWRRLQQHDDPAGRGGPGARAAALDAHARDRDQLQARWRAAQRAVRAAELEERFLAEARQIWIQLTAEAAAQVRALETLRAAEHRRWRQDEERRAEEWLTECGQQQRMQKRRDAD